MLGRFGRQWWMQRGRAAVGSSATDTVISEAVGASVASGDRSSDNLALPAPHGNDPTLPEQPVLLMPSGASRPVHVGELLPARRRSWPLELIRLPVVPKRAILAAGLCAGLAAPGLARHLATRVLFGRPAPRAQNVIEVTRIVYSGPLNPRTAAAIGKVLASGR
jgi:hypothetical protein